MSFLVQDLFQDPELEPQVAVELRILLQYFHESFQIALVQSEDPGRNVLCQDILHLFLADAQRQMLFNVPEEQPHHVGMLPDYLLCFQSQFRVHGRSRIFV